MTARDDSKVMWSLCIDSIVAWETNDLKRCRENLSEIVNRMHDEKVGNIPRVKPGEHEDTSPGTRDPQAVINALVRVRKHPDARESFQEAIDEMIARFARMAADHIKNDRNGFADYYSDMLRSLQEIRKFCSL